MNAALVLLQLHFRAVDNGADITFKLLDNHLIFNGTSMHLKQMNLQSLLVGKLGVAQFTLDELHILHLMIGQHVITIRFLELNLR